MNRKLGLIGQKLGNTQVFSQDGSVTAVTVLEMGPCVVVGKRTPEQHGYSALCLGFGSKRAKLVRKPQAGIYKKAELPVPKVVREFRLAAEDVANYEIGQAIAAKDIFSEGMTVDVTGFSKGRGYTGVMKRHNFAGAGSVGHGTHEYKRHGGSIGMNMTPGRTLANQKMAGQYGNKRTTILSLRVARVMEEEGLVLVEGGVPGPQGGFVTVRGAVKERAEKGRVQVQA